MMVIKRIRNTQATEVLVGNRLILFSYSTPVACKHKGKFLRTEKFHSRTTYRHIKEFLRSSKGEYELRTQEFFDSLIKIHY